MEYVLTAAEMKQADENTMQYFGVPGLVLMERAALAARDGILGKWPEISGTRARILIVAGNGNNGGDGVALARLFFLQGFDVTVLVSGKPEKYSDALKKQLEILEKYLDASGLLNIIEDDVWVKEHDRWSHAWRNYDIVIDALFGIGLSREITGIYREKIGWMNRLSGKKAALDIPSGISAEDNMTDVSCRSAFRADLTVTFGFVKRGMLLYPGRELCGEVMVADIGITKESFLGKAPAGITIGRGAGEVPGLFAPRSADSHKGSYGKVLLVAGSMDTPGAALLSGEAVLRSGAGMLRIVSPIENRELILTSLPEAMYQVLDDGIAWEKLLDWCDCVVIGPGIGQGGQAYSSLEGILGLLREELEVSQDAVAAGSAGRRFMKPLILDADALNMIASSEKLFRQVKEYAFHGGIVIMTPHMAEFARLLDCSMHELRAGRMGKIEEYCRESGVILVSKDAATVAGYCQGKEGFLYYINQTGNNGMATAGSGDVLSGMLGASAALMAAELRHGSTVEKPDAHMVREAYFKAAYRAVYLHGLAGDMAAEKMGQASMKAGDIIEELSGLLP